MAESERNLAKNTFFLYLMTFSSYIFPLFTFPYVTRVLGAEKYGVVVFAAAVMQYFQMVLEFGFILSATGEISFCRDDNRRVAQIMYAVLGAKMILAVAGLFVLSALCLFIEKFIEIRAFLFLYYIATVLTALLPDYLFRGLERMSILTYRVILSKIVNLVLIFTLIRSSGDYLKYPVAAIGANLSAVFLTWFEILFRLKIYPVRISFGSVREELKKSSQFFVSRVAVSMYQTLNTVLLGLKFPSAQLAQYGAANNLTSCARQCISPISDGIYPYMVKNRNYRLVKKLILILEPLIIAGCVVLYFISPWFIKVFCGAGYESAVPIFRAMLPLVVISLPTYLFGYPLMGALGIIKFANLSVIISSVFHLCRLGILYLAGRMGFVSVALLTFATEVVVFAIRVYAAAKKFRANYDL
ncbi:MAG: oligosaccharide flippase family protein [Bacteroides sp.]|nr:oligosaccharide flippase family protein [Prevotella sp.]MCM1407091.1 oligosaccharide flippase family protein [Treponema brennaborense]MCM1470243.1 oligosaccharide flippase family protein [Bacteroides sp.]